MRIVNLYRYEREPGKITVSPIEPEITYTIAYRLIADEGKAITNGDVITGCVDVNSAEGWADCDLPEEPEYGHEPD